jgi:prepilin-type N-terminal cleavage/methylation domain-containing protein
MVPNTSEQSGFTLIELVMVIAILGILAVSAVPKFIDLSGQASQAAVDGVAGAISSASAINYGARRLNNTQGQAVDDCDDGDDLLQSGPLTGYTITAAAITDGNTGTCVVNGENGKTANAYVIGIS